MRLHPRHFVLIAIIIGIFAFNVYRHRRTQQASTFSQQAAPILLQPSIYADPAVNNAWIDFEHAAALRDAPAAQFQPVLEKFNTAQAAIHTTAANAASDPTIDLENCKVWLISYRSGTLTGPNAHTQASEHIDRCVRLYRDAAF
jgi:hypothetical protein